MSGQRRDLKSDLDTSDAVHLRTDRLIAAGKIASHMAIAPSILIAMTEEAGSISPTVESGMSDNLSQNVLAMKDPIEQVALMIVLKGRDSQGSRGQTEVDGLAIAPQTQIVQDLAIRTVLMDQIDHGLKGVGVRKGRLGEIAIFARRKALIARIDPTKTEAEMTALDTTIMTARSIVIPAQIADLTKPINLDGKSEIVPHRLAPRPLSQ